ncbi:MAG: PilZ domain-containing protein [Rhodospirillaceae bacterium]
MTMTDSDRTSEVMDLLLQAEGMLLRMIETARGEDQVAEVAEVLRTLIALRMRIEVPDDDDKRTAARIHERASVQIACDDGQYCEAALHDISAGGALVECDPPLAGGTRCKVILAGSAEPIPAVARAARHGVTPLTFEKLPPAQHLALVKHIERYFARY